MPQSPWFWRLGFAAAVAALPLAVTYWVYLLNGVADTLDTVGAIVWTAFSIMWFITSSLALRQARRGQRATDI